MIHTATTHASKSSYSTRLSESDSAIIWKTFNVQAWQASIRSVVSPQSQGSSNGSSSSGVSHAELGMDCEMVVKIREDLDRAIIRKLQPVDIVKRAERARAHTAMSTLSLPLAGYAFIAARQLVSSDLSLRARSAAGAEVLRQYRKS